MARKMDAFIEHLERYVYAMPLVAGKKTLDAGCKDGFGGHLLSYGAASVTLADISPTYIAQAQKHYRYFSPVEFVTSDFNNGFPDGTFDAVVAFEVIEHVDDPDFFLQNIVEHLNPGGILIFSVPDMMACPEHKTLFDFYSIRALVKRHLVLDEFYIHDSHQFNLHPLYKGTRCYLGTAYKR